jgi:hypothetical protein
VVAIQVTGHYHLAIPEFLLECGNAVVRVKVNRTRRPGSAAHRGANARADRTDSLRSMASGRRDQPAQPGRMSVLLELCEGHAKAAKH